MSRRRYQIIADDLQARIEAGEFDNIIKLPRTVDLVKHYGTSLRTIQTVTETLRARDLIYTIPGQGNYLKKRS